jgi:hypothetical protein
MKTGRLLKFHRPGGDVHAYVYREGGLFRAALYVLTAAGMTRPEEGQSFSAPSEPEVEKDVRAWVEAHFPRHP